MKFGEKLKLQREKLNLSQQALGKELGVTKQTILSYEAYGKYPRKREFYYKIADFFNVDVDYFLSETVDFTLEAKEKYGASGVKQAEQLVNQINGLFAGGELSEDDMDGVMKAMQEVYWRAKEENKKYTPKKYLKKEDLQE